TLPLRVNVVSALYNKIPSPSGSTLVWRSDTPAIATVNASGTVTGVSDGIAEITVSVTANNVTRSATVNIKVGTLKAEFLQPSINYKQLTVLSVHGSNRIANVTADLSAIGGSDREIFHYVPGKNELTVGLAGSDFGPLTSRTVNIPVTVTLTDNTSRNLTAALEIVPYQTSTFDWDEARIYFLLTDRFAGQDKQNIYTGQITPSDETYTSGTIGLNQYHGGDIAGLTAKIPYLKDLGVNTVWITPIVDNIEFDVGGAVKDSFGYAGYWAKTFEERLNSALEAQLGSKDDLSSLITALHSNGMKLMVDIVINHAGYGMDQVWEPNWDTDDNAALRPTIDQMGEFILPDGSSMFRSIAEDNADGDNRIKSRLVGLPDFKTENWYVRDMLAKWQTKWTTKYDIDYFRVDTVKHVDNDTWRALKNAVVSNNPDFKMIGELYAGSVDIKGAGNEDGGTSEDYLAIDQLDSLLDFDFKNIALGFVTWKSLKTIQVANGTEQIKIENSAGSKVNVSDIIDALKHREAFLEANPLLSMGQFLSSHDEDGFLTRFAPGTAAKDKHSEFMNAASLLVTSMGQPVIYYGEELGQFGKYSNNSASKFDDNRYDFNWTAQGENPMMLQHYKALLNSRADYSKAFSRGERLYNTDYGKYVKDGGSVLSFTAEYDNNTPDDTSDDEIVLVAINRSDVEQPINFDGTPFDAGSALKDMYGEKRASYGNYTAKGDLIVGADGNISEIIVPKKSDGGTVIYVLTDTLKIKEKEYIQVNKSADYSAWNVSRTGGAETEVTDAAWSIVAPASSGDYAWSLTPEADVDILRRIDTVTNTSVEAGKINKSTGLFTAGEIPGLELTITAQKGVQQAEFIITTVDLEIDGDKVLAVDDTGVHTYNKKIKTSQTILDSLMSKADASDLDSNGDTTEKLYIFKWEITDGDSMAEIDSETGELKLKAGASPGTVNIKVSIQTNVTSVSPNKPLVDYSDIYAEYTISVSPSQSENTDIKSVTVADIPATRVGDNQYKVTVPAGTSVSAGSFTVALKDTNATVGAVEYTAGDNGGTGVFKITAQNGHTATYAVNVTIAPQEGVKTTKLALAPDSGYTIDVVRGYPQRFVVTMTPEFESLTNSYLFWTLTLSGAETDIADVEWDPDGRAAVVTSNIISGSKNVTLRVRDSVSNKTAAIVLHIISASEVEEDTYKVLPAGVSINRDGDPVVGVSTFKAETIYPINTPEGFQAAPQFEWKTTLGGDEEAAKKVAELENADTEEVTVTSKLESGSKNLTLRLRELLTDKVVSIVIHILGGILNEDGAAKIPPTGIASIERNEDTQNGLQSYTAISSYPDLTPEGAKMAPSYTWSITISNALAPENIVTLENENADTVIVHSHITSGTKKATLRVTDSVSGKSKSTVITLTPAS
ncbi:MAG: Ig-like domain-containing protein, partial [Clostridiales bacterium]|nr:Ig-like domain-containing protein [Clostridiales bacterium]